MSVFLDGAILGTMVNTGNANKLQNNQFLDPNAQMCPVWNGQDLAGRPSCEYGFYTKVAGCNSPMDRILVENALRPAYANYITLTASGIAGDIATYRQGVRAQNGQFGTASPAESVTPANNANELNAVNGNNNLKGARMVNNSQNNGNNSWPGADTTLNPANRFNNRGVVDPTRGTTVVNNQYVGTRYDPGPEYVSSTQNQYEPNSKAYPQSS